MPYCSIVVTMLVYACKIRLRDRKKIIRIYLVIIHHHYHHSQTHIGHNMHTSSYPQFCMQKLCVHSALIKHIYIVERKTCIGNMVHSQFCSTHTNHKFHSNVHPRQRIKSYQVSSRTHILILFLKLKTFIYSFNLCIIYEDYNSLYIFNY